MTPATDQIAWLGGGVTRGEKRSSPCNRTAVSNHITSSAPAGVRPLRSDDDTRARRGPLVFFFFRCASTEAVREFRPAPKPAAHGGSISSKAFDPQMTASAWKGSPAPAKA